jgi:fatty-acyl-CoA synthase
MLAPMAIGDTIQAIRTEGRAAVERLKIIGRVGKKTGMHTAMSWRGARLLARELAKGKQNPSLIFKFHAENTPHRIALVAPHSITGATSRGSEGGARDRAYSFFELNERIDALCAALSRLGVGPGTAVLFVLKNRPEFLMAQTAAGRVGGSTVTASFRSTAPELEYLVQHSGTRVIFFDADIAATIRALQAGPAALPASHVIAVGGPVEGFPTLEDLFASGSSAAAAEDKSEESAVVMYTSGTTGKPKGAVRKIQKNALALALSFIGETPLEVGGTHLVVCPLYHATAFAFTGFSFLLGHSVIVLNEFRPEVFLQAVERYRVTSTAVVPTMLHRLLELGPDVIRRYDTSSLQAIFSGGAPLSASLANEVLDVLGDKLFNFYGATETGIVTVAGPDDLRASPGTIGRPVPGVEVRLLDEHGREVADGEVGEIYVRSGMLISGYHADPDATSKSMREGFFSVGDLARRDRRGCYLIEGRKRDMIISGGVNVYPAEVEAALDGHPGVLEAAVVGVPDREWGERVRAYVVRRQGADVNEDELKAFCRGRLAGPKVPRDFVFIDALPKNPTGKVLKRELRERARAEAGP